MAYDLPVVWCIPIRGSKKSIQITYTGRLERTPVSKQGLFTLDVVDSDSPVIYVGKLLDGQVVMSCGQFMELIERMQSMLETYK